MSKLADLRSYLDGYQSPKKLDPDYERLFKKVVWEFIIPPVNHNLALCNRDGWGNLLIKKRHGGRCPVADPKKLLRGFYLSLFRYYTESSTRTQYVERLTNFMASYDDLQNVSLAMEKTQNGKTEKRKFGIPYKPKQRQITKGLISWLEALKNAIDSPGFEKKPKITSAEKRKEPQLIKNLFLTIAESCPDLPHTDIFYSIAKASLWFGANLRGENWKGRTSRYLEKPDIVKSVQDVETFDDLVDKVILTEARRIQKIHCRHS
jgi:hypothetical protein